MLLALLLGFVLPAYAPAYAEVTRVPVTQAVDQHDTLQCWAVAATARMEVDAARIRGHFVRLSPRYLVYVKTLEEVTQQILHRDFATHRAQLCETCAPEDIYYEQGGLFADAAEAARLSGVVPNEAYPDLPLEDESLFRNLNALIGDYARGARESGRGHVTEIRAQVAAVLDAALGRPPESFEFEGERYDPTALYDRILPAWRTWRPAELNFEAHAKHDSIRYVPAFSGEKYPASYTPHSAELIATLATELRALRTPVLGYRIVDEEHTHHGGVIGFAAHGLLPPPSFDWDDTRWTDHYVLAVGADWDDQGRLRRVLIKNSVGTGPEDGFGFQWIEADYFFLINSVELPDSR